MDGARRLEAMQGGWHGVRHAGMGWEGPCREERSAWQGLHCVPCQYALEQPPSVPSTPPPAAGGTGTPAYVHLLPCPDTYRGLHLDGAAAARHAIAAARAAGGRVAAFFCESIISCGGQVRGVGKGYKRVGAHAAGCACSAGAGPVQRHSAGPRWLPCRRVAAALSARTACRHATFWPAACAVTARRPLLLDPR